MELTGIEPVTPCLQSTTSAVPKQMQPKDLR